MWLIHAAFIHFKWIAPKFSWLPECSCMLTVSALGISITSLVANHNQLKVHLNGPPKHLSSNAKQNLRFTKDSFSSIASEHNNWFSVRYDQNLPIPLPYTESWDMRENKSCSFSCHLVLRNLKHFHFKKGSEKTKKSVFICEYQYHFDSYSLIFFLDNFCEFCLFSVKAMVFQIRILDAFHYFGFTIKSKLTSYFIMEYCSTF